MKVYVIVRDDWLGGVVSVHNSMDAATSRLKDLDKHKRDKRLCYRIETYEVEE